MQSLQFVSLTTRLVLIVDDDHQARSVTRDFLEEEGIETIEARSADEAVKILESESRIKFVVTDARMPGQLDGVQLAQLIGHRWADIKVVLTSGFAQPSNARLPQGIFILAKPFKLAALLPLIAAA